MLDSATSIFERGESKGKGRIRENSNEVRGGGKGSGKKKKTFRGLQAQQTVVHRAEGRKRKLSIWERTWVVVFFFWGGFFGVGGPGKKVSGKEEGNTLNCWQGKEEATSRLNEE